ncbi:MAG: hypothetical protein MUF24_02365 [Chitinophagaceae bacterium]|nr:hypothetical protein [Chitinophagaceae bacterium]
MAATVKKCPQCLNFAAMFTNRPMVVATMHQKEKVMAPLLEKALGVHCLVPKGINTDSLGTFSGEVERLLDPIATLRQKCRLAMQLTGTDLAVGSEGSFGPHPTLYFVPANDEMVMLIDDKNGLEIVARELSTQTNFAGEAIGNRPALLAFAEKTGFPEHALILRPNRSVNNPLIKGITTYELLTQTFDRLFETYGEVYAETDMRAMHNPTRQQVIAAATQKLIAKAKSACPQCGMPGYDVAAVKPGLPCSWCGLPTRSTLSWQYRCSHCGHQHTLLYPHGKTAEDPMYCDGCNP